MKEEEDEEDEDEGYEPGAADTLDHFGGGKLEAFVS